METEREYYKKLYTSKNPDKTEIQEYIKNTKIQNHLSKKDSQTLEGILTEEECTNAVFKMKLNKSPGFDGISVEFYRTFWPQLKSFVVQVFNKCYERGELTNLQKIGLISLIYKKK